VGSLTSRRRLSTALRLSVGDAAAPEVDEVVIVTFIFGP
jgi:hypothetical protein